MDPASPPTGVAVCVATYRRPAYLRTLLGSLAALETEGLAVRVVVVDNDAAGSARPVVEGFAAALPGLTYEVESQRGIASARNRLVALAAAAGAEVDYLAFVDDDEWVEPDWLVRLVATAETLGADAVAGPVVPHLDDGAPAWVAAGRFFERPRYRTGTPVRYLATGNVLFARRALAGIAGPFDRRFDLSGGSDTRLSDQLHRAGARLVWCDEATVHERIPASRANAGWLVRRSFRVGVTLSRSARLVGPAAPQVARRLAKALGRLAQGLALLPVAAVGGRATAVRALSSCAQGAGGVLGLVGYRYLEYRDVHGR